MTLDFARAATYDHSFNATMGSAHLGKLDLPKEGRNGVNRGLKRMCTIKHSSKMPELPLLPQLKDHLLWTPKARAANLRLSDFNAPIFWPTAIKLLHFFWKVLGCLSWSRRSSLRKFHLSAAFRLPCQSKQI